MTSKILLLAIIFYFAAYQRGTNAAKICYQCDELHPSSRWKFWGEKITKCSAGSFDTYATKTSRAFGADALTCYTKFNDAGAVIKRGAYGLGEVLDKNYKCKDRRHICCKSSFCNRHVNAPCPADTPVEKKEVKACYQCKGAENCHPDRLPGSELRTSSALGGANLYCFTEFDPVTGAAIARGGFGFGEVLDKSLKCDSKFFLCCYDNLCNTQTVGHCARGQANQQQPQQPQQPQQQDQQQQQQDQQQDQQQQHDQQQHHDQQHQHHDQQQHHDQHQQHHDQHQQHHDQHQQQHHDQHQQHHDQQHQQHYDQQQHQQQQYDQQYQHPDQQQQPQEHEQHNQQ